jgi:hypothetical protein
MIRTLLFATLLLALTVYLANALVTRDGVGAGEYVVGAALLAAMVPTLFRVSRKAFRRA